MLSYLSMQAQSLPITIDESFEDWENCTAVYLDNINESTGVDLLNFSVTNDEQFLFLKVQFATEFDLTDNNNFAIHIDTDNDPNTGISIENIGAELRIFTGDKDAIFNIGGSNLYLDLSDIQFRALPTVTATTFEIAIGRNVLPDNVNELFPTDDIAILMRFQNGDQMPEEDETFVYTFDNTPTEPYIPIDFAKDNDTDLRIAGYNVLQSGLEDPNRIASLERIIGAVGADIFTFSEAYDMTESYVLDFFNNVDSTVDWHAYTHDDLAVVSAYPIIQNWVIYYGRLTASLIDLPDDLYARDILVFSAHLSCCDNDEGRQEQADRFVSFIRDAKTMGGQIDLIEGTPFVLTGDLNLVGFSQQLTTLVTGDIVNNDEWGEDFLPDWDDTPLTDEICLQTDKRMAYTWRNDNSAYPPGRLDFMIFSDDAMAAQKSFCVQTSVMSEDRLALYGLQANDTPTASDHFPVVCDFEIFPYEPTVLNIKVLLEGCYDAEGLMFANLSDVLPTNQPYNIAPYFYEGTESVEVFYENIVDWILVQANLGEDLIPVETHAGLLLKDGSIVASDGNALSFTNLAQNQAYSISIHHQNHLDVVSAQPILITDTINYDFSENIEMAFGEKPMTLLSDNKAALFAGDCWIDGVIQTTDYDLWKLQEDTMGYHATDLNLDAITDSLDYELWQQNNSIFGVFRHK